MERTRPSARPGGDARLVFPDALELAGAPALHAAAGARARAMRDDHGGLRVRVHAHAAQIRVLPDFESVAVRVWPFGSERVGNEGTRERLFVAPESALVVIEREMPNATSFSVEADAKHPLVVQGNGMPLASPARVDATGGLLRLVVGIAGEDLDADALMSSAIARARRRNAMRPRVHTPARDRERLALAEHALRLEQGIPDLVPHAAASALAYLALGDGAAAAGRLRTIEDAGAAAAVVAGAWVAWLGAPVPNRRVRESCHAWIREQLIEPDVGYDAWSQAGLALAPVAAEMIDDPRLRADLRALTTPDAARWLAMLGHELEREGWSRAAGDVLRLLHGEWGVLPDAPRGRLRLAPVLAEGLSVLERITQGEAAVTLRCEVGRESAIIAIAQVSGAAPVTAILEPAMPARRLTGAAIDDVPAQLNAEPTPNGLRVKVQLVLDAPRTVRLELEPG